MSQSRHFTTHSPDTCNCIYEYYDDVTDGSGNVIHEAKQVVKLCSLHAAVTDKNEHIKAIKKEQHLRSTTKENLITSLPSSIVDLDEQGNIKLDTLPMNLIEFYTGEGKDRVYNLEFELKDNPKTLLLKAQDLLKIENDFIAKIKASLLATKTLEGNTFTIDRLRDLIVKDKKQNNKKIDFK